MNSTLSFSIASWDSWRNLGVSYWYSLFPGHWNQNFMPSQIIVYNLRADLGPIPAQKSAIDSFPKCVEVEFSKLCIKTHVFLMKTYPAFCSLSCHFLHIKKFGFHPSLTCAVLLLDIWKSTQKKKTTINRDKTDKLGQSSSNTWLFWKDSLQRFFTLKAFLEALRWSRKPNLHKSFQELVFWVCAKLLQLCLPQLDTVSWTQLCNPMDYSLPGSSVHGIFQARILEWVAVPSSRGSSWPRDWTHASYISALAGRFLITSVTWKMYFE